jgi:hypothetical protein
VNDRNDGGRSIDISTSLYLVRVWKRKSGDGAFSLHGKLQHIASGASCYFDGLSSLPLVLEQMVEQEAGSLGPSPNASSSADNSPEQSGADGTNAS